ncbi:hypothetical protein QYF61_022670, partial [Mycteria americana]
MSVSATSTCLLITSNDDDSTTSLGRPVQTLDNPFGNFPNIQCEPPLAQLEAVSSCPITCYLEKETNPHLSTTSFQVVIGSDKVSPEPPFLQAKQSHFPQPLLTGLVLQTLHQLCCSSLDTCVVMTVFHQCTVVSDRDIFNQIRLLRALSNLTLNVSRGGASTTSLGNLFQCLTTLFDQQVLNHPWQFLAFLSCFLTPGDRELLCSMESVLKDLPALFCCLVPEGKLEVRFPKIQGPDFTLCLSHIPQDCELHQCMITAAQAASSLD